jgi:hypothetical protein
METRKLSLQEMEVTEGGSKVLDCISQVTGGMGVLWGTAAALAFRSNPVGWALIGLSAISFAAGVASNPGACD